MGVTCLMICNSAMTLLNTWHSWHRGGQNQCQICLGLVLYLTHRRRQSQEREVGHAFIDDDPKEKIARVWGKDLQCWLLCMAWVCRRSVKHAWIDALNCVHVHECPLHAWKLHSCRHACSCGGAYVHYVNCKDMKYCIEAMCGHDITCCPAHAQDAVCMHVCACLCSIQTDH